MPYLGILTTDSALVCIILLMMEHPQLNAESITRARLQSDGGRLLITTQTVGGASEVRLTTTKPRANAERSVILTPLARRVVEKVIDWTRLSRADLYRRGEPDEANRLWVGAHGVAFTYIAFSHKSIVDRIKGCNGNGRAGLLHRHPELTPWAKKLTLKNIRKNVGILEYLRSGGDAVRAAHVFGHKGIQTTLDDYIPPALKLAIYERQIRRHQNLLLAAAHAGRDVPLEALDFDTVADVHAFLSEMFAALPLGHDEPVREALAEFLGHSPGGRDRPVYRTVSEREGQLILDANPRRLAVALVYGDQLRNASTSFLDLVDPATKVPPRFWLEFGHCLESGLPHAHARVARLVKEAKALKEEVAESVSFPNIW